MCRRCRHVGRARVTQGQGVIRQVPPAIVVKEIVVIIIESIKTRLSPSAWNISNTVGMRVPVTVESFGCRLLLGQLLRGQLWLLLRLADLHCVSDRRVTGLLLFLLPAPTGLLVKSSITASLGVMCGGMLSTGLLAFGVTRGCELAAAVVMVVHPHRHHNVVVLDVHKSS